MANNYHYVELRDRVDSLSVNPSNHETNQALLVNFRKKHREQYSTELFEVVEMGLEHGNKYTPTLGASLLSVDKNYNAVRLKKDCIIYSSISFESDSHCATMRNTPVDPTLGETGALSSLSRGDVLFLQYRNAANWHQTHFFGRKFKKDQILYFGTEYTGSGVAANRGTSAYILAMALDSSSLLNVQSDTFVLTGAATNTVPTVNTPVGPGGEDSTSIDLSGADFFVNNSAGVNTLYTVNHTAYGTHFEFSSTRKSFVLLQLAYRLGANTTMCITRDFEGNKTTSTYCPPDAFLAYTNSYQAYHDQIGAVFITEPNEKIKLSTNFSGADTRGFYGCHGAIQAIELF